MYHLQLIFYSTMRVTWMRSNPDHFMSFLGRLIVRNVFPLGTLIFLDGLCESRKNSPSIPAKLNTNFSNTSIEPLPKDTDCRKSIKRITRYPKRYAICTSLTFHTYAMCFATNPHICTRQYTVP
jgi:hypothetical protein